MSTDHDDAVRLSARVLPATGLVLYEGSDERRIHEQVARHFAPHLMRRRGDGGLAVDFRLVHGGGIAVYVLRYGGEVEVTVGDLDFYCLHVAHTGGGVVT